MCRHALQPPLSKYSGSVTLAYSLPRTTPPKAPQPFRRLFLQGATSRHVRTRRGARAAGGTSRMPSLLPSWLVRYLRFLIALSFLAHATLRLLVACNPPPSLQRLPPNQCPVAHQLQAPQSPDPRSFLVRSVSTFQVRAAAAGSAPTTKRQVATASTSYDLL